MTIPSIPPEIIPGLSPAESVVICEAVKGGTVREVASALDLSWKTVKWHFTRSYKKLGVKNRTQLALKVEEIRRGMQ